MMIADQIRAIALVCLSIFGCTGNILTFIIVNQQFFRKTASAAFISGLCIADCIVLCLHSLQIVGKAYAPKTSYDCVVFFFLDVFRLMSVWIVCFINLERCALVCNPCRIPRLTSPTKARIFVIVVFVLSLIIFSHYSVHMQMEFIAINGTNPVRSVCLFKPGFHRIAWECLRSAVTYWFTIPVCIVCNIIIIKSLYQASRIERAISSSSSDVLHLSSKQRQLTAMLVASSICFILTSTPSTVHSIYLSMTKHKTKHQYYIHIFTNILLHFHYASNFLVFAFSCARFRAEFVDLFRNHICGRIFNNWQRHAIPATEQIYVHSTRQRKQPVKLFTAKSHAVKRNNPNGIVVLGMNSYKNKTGRNYGHSVQNYMK